MAIASIVLHGFPASLRVLQEGMQAAPEVVSTQIVEPDRIAAAIEAPAARLPHLLRELEKLPGALNLELVFINYEDDIETCGGIACPPLAEIMKQ